MSVSKKKSSLGSNPLNAQSKGIFTKTETLDLSSQEKRIKKEEKRIQNQESSFLSESEKEKVNVRLPIELNDWLDDLVKKSKRRHGHKIPKEVWVQAALEIFRSFPVDWEAVDSIDRLKEELKNQESRIKILPSIKNSIEFDKYN